INKRLLKKYNCEAVCFMADEDVAAEAGARGITRATVSMERAMKLGKPVVFVVGNAPTALITLHEHMLNGYRPSFVIGVPVGFVNVEAAKELITASDVPFIVNRGRKGGSNVAAAIVNAVLYDMNERQDRGRVLLSCKSKTAEPSTRLGFTTGSCAAAAAKAAAYMLISGNRKDSISIDTPTGITYNTDIEDISVDEGRVSCAVRKYSGDDPDITNDILVYASVEYMGLDRVADISTGEARSLIYIEGGEGVGTVTRTGLDQPVGNAAINSVPRAMITKEVSEVMELFDHHAPLRVVISVPEGVRLAGKTFNPRLGIEGGISIIGTSGIVEPMSTRALLETIRLELNQHRQEGEDTIVISPGNYGMTFMKERYGYDLDKAVKCSNYIGDTIDMAAELGYKQLLLVGHIGKLIKCSGGIMNTHSREADSRMELMAAAAIRADADAGTLTKVLASVSTEEAFGYIKEAGIEQQCMEYMVKRIEYYLNKRAGDKLNVKCIVYSNEFGLLGSSEGADRLLTDDNTAAAQKNRSTC
ncbi:MAG: cobalt-precorrin-5B (C(1))-methyltransferase CbiD, partial [Lachnospiraceae bacterium]|nr:cobalt-precorrin-5B (C(1))-methyltransferase CbiD [Lachnospiraceae bacterium]